jgi:transcriptional regulator of acetoin/glycerol metabolism
MTALEVYNWPGNIRELRNVLERAALICKDGVIRHEDLHFQLARASAKPASDAFPTDTDMTLNEMERQHISNVLRKEKGKVDRAAATLGIPRSSLYVKLKQYGITTQ